MNLVLVIGDPSVAELCVAAGLGVQAILGESLSYAEGEAAKVLRAHPQLPLVLGVADGAKRKFLVEFFQRSQRRFQGVVHPSAQVSESAEIGMGAIIQFGCFVGADCKVGAFAYLDVGAILMPEASVANYADVGPRALMMPGSRLAPGDSIDAGAVLHPRAE